MSLPRLGGRPISKRRPFGSLTVLISPKHPSNSNKTNQLKNVIVPRTGLTLPARNASDLRRSNTGSGGALGYLSGAQLLQNFRRQTKRFCIGSQIGLSQAGPVAPSRCERWFGARRARI